MGNTSVRGRRHRGSRPGMLPVVVMLIAFALASCSSGGTATPSAPSGALTWSTRTLQSGATSTATSRSGGAAGTASSTTGNTPGKPARPWMP